VDDVMNADLTPTLEKWGFIGLGVFTSCCYTNDFAPLDLLRFPQTFSARVENRIAIFNLPNWVPQDHGILQVGDGQLYSKLRDLPLPKQVKPAGDNQKTLALQLPETVANTREVTITYWPLFRFAHTGKPFAIEGSAAAFACRIIDYAARRAGFNVSKIENAGEHSGLQMKTAANEYHFKAEGVNDLRKLSLHTGEHILALDIENRSLTLSDVLTPNLAAAVRAMLNEGNSLKNCAIDTARPGTIQIQYQGALRV
jgi:hypothetical protein